MTNQQHGFENWWEEHPLLKKFYVPMVLTATFLVTVFDIFTGSRGR